MLAADFLGVEVAHHDRRHFRDVASPIDVLCFVADLRGLVIGQRVIPDCMISTIVNRISDLCECHDKLTRSERGTAFDGTLAKALRAQNLFIVASFINGLVT